MKSEKPVHETIVEVAYRDTDSIGHLSSPVYYVYMQSAYLKYMWELYGHGPEKKLPQIMVKTSCDYLKPAHCNEKLRIATRIARFGSKSFDVQYEFFRGETDELVAKGSSVHVMFDYEKEKSLPVPEEFKAQVATYQAESFESAAA